MSSPLQRTEIALLSPAAKLAGHLFELLDADGSGALDEEEGRTYLLSAGCVPDELDFYWRDLLRVSDGNDDGLVSKEEFLRYTFNDVELTEAGKFRDDGFSKDLRSQIASLGSAGTLVGTLFDIMDADGSGYMEEDEGKHYLSACGCIDSELDYYWGDLKRCADTNRDGRISRSEFLNYVVADMDLDAEGNFTDVQNENEIRQRVAVLGPAGQLCARLFDCLDVDGSGFLDNDEIKEYFTMQGMPDEELDYYLQDLLRAHDVDKDGLIAKDEFLAYVLGDEELDERGEYTNPGAMVELQSQLLMHGPAAQLSSALFDLVDADGSGFMEEDEGKVFLQLQGCDETELDYYWSDLLRAADTNKDGRIDKKEFLSYVLGDTELTDDGSFAMPADASRVKMSLATLGPAGRLVQKLFDLIDSDGSGQLDEHEGKEFLLAMGTDESELDYYWADLARCADRNRDGLISRSEFLNYILGEVEVSNDGEITDPEFEQDLRMKVRLLGSAGQKVSTLFNMIDTDGSGYLDESEGKRFLGAVGCEEAELDYYWADLLRCADTDRDGLISKEEFMQYTMGDVELDEDGEVDADFERDLKQKIVMMGPTGKLVNTLFDLIDSDASGFLEEEEGKYFFSVVGCDPAELDYYWADLLRCADANRDGKISKEEFLRYTMGDIEVDDDGRCEDMEFEADMRRKVMLLGPAGQLVGALFDAIDADGSGYMEEVEGKQFLAVGGCEDPAEREYYWNDLLRTADLNHDGKISKEEFLAYILGDEELNAEGSFSDEARWEELSAAARQLGGTPPRRSQRIPEGVPRPTVRRPAPAAGGDDAAETVGVVLTALANHGTADSADAARAAQSACTALWNVAFHDRGGARALIARSGGVASLARVMQHHAAVAEIQEAGCNVLWSLSHDPAGRARVAAEGGLGALVDAVCGGQCSPTPDLLEGACGTLGNLALDAAQQQALGRVGATGLVQDAMQCFPQDANLQATGCLALNNLQ